MTPWHEYLAAALLLASGLLSLIAAVGLLRLKDYFARLHAPSLANTGAAWCVTLATVVCFSATQSRLALYAVVLNVLLALTAPVTTILLARTGLFRKRLAGKDVPPPLDAGPGWRGPAG